MQSFQTFSYESAYILSMCREGTCDSIESVNETEEKYLKLSLKKLESHLPESFHDMFLHYSRGEYDFLYGEIGGGLHACIFSYPVPEEAEQVILLVYEGRDRIIADAAGCHIPVRELLKGKEIYDFLSSESDWMYLEHYIICSYMFPELPYPFCQSHEDVPLYCSGEALLYSNAYVTKAFRRQGIFRAMTEIMREFVLRNCTDRTELYSVISLDPDVACYGPDAQDAPYIYSYEKDEPDRQRNIRIMERLGYEALRLQEDDPSAEQDGTKLWFAVRQESDLIIESDPV